MIRTVNGYINWVIDQILRHGQIDVGESMNGIVEKDNLKGASVGWRYLIWYSLYLLFPIA